MLNWLYKRNKRKFWELIVADFYGEVPESIKEPSIDFLAKARPTLERFFSIQAYNMQRRSISDAKNADIYAGMLLHIRTLLVIITKGKVGVGATEDKIAVAKEVNPLIAVEEFVKLAKQPK